MALIVKQLDIISQTYKSRVTALRETFNKNLFELVKDWEKTASNTYVNSEGLEGFKRIVEVIPLSRSSGGTRKTIRARILLTVIPLPLTNFFIEQQRVSTGNSINSASVRRGKYSESKKGSFTSYEDTFTKAKVLRQGQPRLVQPKGKTGTLASANGIKAFMYSPSNRVTAKPETPLGIYVRLQSKTWQGQDRLPTYKIYAPPLAILMLSKRVRKRIKLEQRIENLHV